MQSRYAHSSLSKLAIHRLHTTLLARWWKTSLLQWKCSRLNGGQNMFANSSVLLVIGVVPVFLQGKFLYKTFLPFFIILIIK